MKKAKKAKSKKSFQVSQHGRKTIASMVRLIEKEVIKLEKRLAKAK